MSRYAVRRSTLRGNPRAIWVVQIAALLQLLAFGTATSYAGTARPSSTPTATPTPIPVAGSASGFNGVTGDCNENARVSIDELVRGVNIALDRQALDNCPAFDADNNGRVTVDELVLAVGIALRGAPPTFTPTHTPTEIPSGDMVTLVGSSPAHGESGVALTRETVLRFDGPLDPSTVTSQSIAPVYGGGGLFARLHVAPDRKTVTLFYEVFLPASARVRVLVNGGLLHDANGVTVDADGDGQPGGVAIIDFDTLSITTLPGTAVCGRVFASELVPGANGTSVNVPLAGVTIEVDGAAGALNAVTDQFGNFRLEPAPVGRFFVFIRGTTATVGVPPGAYYPDVAKAWQSVAGVETSIGEIFLPLIEAGTLQPVSATQATTIRFPPSILQDFPELGDVSIVVPANALYENDGTRGGMVGIAPVPPDRIPSRLPPGLAFPVVITVQTDGPQNFDAPVPACFPNLPDPSTGLPLAPGSESALWSFNHDTGEFEVVGPMRVSADGRLVCTEAGVGIIAPGWHGSQPGVGAGGGPILGDDTGSSSCPVCEPEPCPTCDNCCQGCGDGLLCPNCGEECDEGPFNGGLTCTASCTLPCDHPDSGGCQPPTGGDADCGANVCNPFTGNCELQPMNAGGGCDVGNPCSFGGTCDGGGNCDAQPNDAGTCDDGQECTSGDHCEDGQCVGNPVSPGTACCGNGQVDAGEECDTGAGNSDTTANACRTNCSDPFCGDGVTDSMGVSGTEECDDGEAQNTGDPNACRPNCKSPFCGDNIVDTNFGEECDLANDNSLTPNSCRPDCKNPRCGDGLLDDDFGETCDDGAGNSNTIPDSCRDNCSLPRCGDGVVDSNNVCDDGNSIDGDGCSSDCLPECGNGVVDQGEQCDDDNTVACDGCSASCQPEQCGNGVVECAEQCDEGGVGGVGPGCRNPCMLAKCGDGTVDASFGEECDDGGTVSGDGCSANCQTEECGNFALDPGEACDDGNSAGCDGCAADCGRADRVCGDGIQECGEACDDGANNSDVLPNHCRAATCLPAGCGDGVLDTGETCDDGNVTSNDGCSASCQTEIGVTPFCGDGIVQTGEQCDDGAANANTPNACRPLTCQLPRCGDGIEDDAPPNLEACDDGNTADGDACPASCQLELQLEPRLIIGLGLCGIQPRDIEVTEQPGGQVLTTDPNVEYEFVSADGLDRVIIDEVWAFLRLRQMQNGVPQDQLLPEEPPIADIEVVNGQVVFNSEGVNVLRARRGNATSNFAFVIGGGLQLAEAKSLKIKPFSLVNIGVNTAADLINKELEKAEKEFRVDPPMFLFLGQLCLPVVDVTPGDVGLIGVAELKFDLFNGEIEDVDLMDALTGLINLIPDKSPILWLAKATLKVAAQIGVAQLLEFGIGDNGGQAVITVSENFSLTDPPFLGGIVEAVAPGVAVVEGKFEMECVGEAEDDMLVFVAPELVGTDIRNEAAVVEDPLITPFAPAARRPHAVGFFNVLSGTHQLEIETPPLLPEEEIAFLEALLPGELEIAVGLTQPLTLPLGASIGLSGFYEEGDFFLSIDGVTATFAAAGGVTLALESVDLQTRLPNFATAWTVIDPTIAVLDNNPSPIGTERELSCIQPGDTEVQVDACLIGASINTVSDLNGVHCLQPNEPCGDGFADPGETCDPPGEPILSLPGAFCRGDCTFCGDGFVQFGDEGCDDGNDVSGDGCEPNCLPTLCGDGIVQGPDETCDPPGVPKPPHGNLCRSSCTFCGDGKVDAGEACDDGTAPGGCLPNCTQPTSTPTNTATGTNTPTPTATPTGPTLTPSPTQCGDGIVQPPEQCDDGNAVDGDACNNDCTIPVDIPLPLELCISEVVTDPQSDWSDSTGQAGQDFDATPGPGPATPGDPDNEYIEIRNTSNRFLTLAGVVLRMSDSALAFHQFGLGSSLEHYSLNSNAFVFRPGAVVVIGNPVGELDDDVFLELFSPGGALITDLEIGGNFASTNFEADDDHDGLVNEDGPDGLDEDGDFLVDEDGIAPPFRPDPTADGAPGVGLDGQATDATDEALHRVADTPTMLAAVGPLAFEFPLDARNYLRGRGTPRLVPPFTDRLTIDEVVTRPLRDWSDGSGVVGVPFDEFPGPGPIAAGDPRNEFIEIRNRGAVAVRVRDMVLHMNDATPATYRIGSLVGGTVERYTSPSTTPSSADALQPGGMLVIGDPPGQLDDQIFIALVVPCVGTVSDVEIGGTTLATNFESDSDRDGLVDEDPLDGTDNDGDGFTDEDRNGPDPVSDGAPPQPAGNNGEALRRISDDVDDSLSFVRGNGNPGVPTGPIP